MSSTDVACCDDDVMMPSQFSLSMTAVRRLVASVLLVIIFGHHNVVLCRDSDVTALPGPEYGGVFCETEAFNASCDLGAAILMTYARYGRMQLSRCVRHDYGHVGCSSDVIELVDSRCSARRRCVIRVPDAVLATTKPCPDDLKPYLEARYVCVRVETPRSTCDDVTNSLPVSVPGPGYIANLVTEATGCGGPLRPWRISAQRGQIVRLSLLDFTRPTTLRRCAEVRSSGDVMTSSATCDALAVVREPVVSNVGWLNTSVTSRRALGHALRSDVNSRENLVYVSHGHVVDVAILTRDDAAEVPYFMLKYEVIGCPDTLSSAGYGSWYSTRTDDTLTVYCNQSVDVVYHLHCRHNRWTGDVINCSTSYINPEIDWQTTDVRRQFIVVAHGISVAIALVTALIIGLLVLTIGLAYIRGRPAGRMLMKASRQRHASRRHGSQSATKSSSRSTQLTSRDKVADSSLTLRPASWHQRSMPPPGKPSCHVTPRSPDVVDRYYVTESPVFATPTSGFLDVPQLSMSRLRPPTYDFVYDVEMTSSCACASPCHCDADRCHDDHSLCRYVEGAISDVTEVTADRT